jgi:hypothetical protein
MDPELHIAGKSEPHLFSLPVRPDQSFSDDGLTETALVQAAQNIFAGVQPNRSNLVADSGVPLVAIPFGFGQLRHQVRLRGDRLATSLKQSQLGGLDPVFEEWRS